MGPVAREPCSWAGCWVLGCVTQMWVSGAGTETRGKGAPLPLPGVESRVLSICKHSRGPDKPVKDKDLS